MPQNLKKSAWNFQNSYTSLSDKLYTKVFPEPVANPQISYFNESLAKNLGLMPLLESKSLIIDYLSGNKIPSGSNPIAQAYAGHQFGNFTNLGDGRAILLGELLSSNNKLFDLQLKGAGRTPYSRNGDGRATLSSMLREYLMSESMYRLKIPTTRSLAVIDTGEKVYRDKAFNGGILTRIASSHIRVGTFEYVENTSSTNDLDIFSKYVLNRHFPELLDLEYSTVEMLKSVMFKQIDLIVNWLRVGFIHGVMNTDNMSISGETIDYGPCAFMNIYNPHTVFSSIDRNSRYSFMNQPKIAHWNLAVFAGTLLPVISEDRDQSLKIVKEVLNTFSTVFTEKWYHMMSQKIGIKDFREDDKKIIDMLLALMEKYSIDYTNFFIMLRFCTFLDEGFSNTNDFKTWYVLWKKRVQVKGKWDAATSLMESQNPLIIPRNHLVERALEEAASGNNTSFEHLLQLVSKPYDYSLGIESLQTVPENYDESYKTYCGT